MAVILYLNGDLRKINKHIHVHIYMHRSQCLDLSFSIRKLSDIPGSRNNYNHTETNGSIEFQKSGTALYNVVGYMSSAQIKYTFYYIITFLKYSILI